MLQRQRQVAELHRLLGVAGAAEGALAGSVAVTDVARDRAAAPTQLIGAEPHHLAVLAEQLVGHRRDVEDPLRLVEVRGHRAGVSVADTMTAAGPPAPVPMSPRSASSRAPSSTSRSAVTGSRRVSFSFSTVTSGWPS